MSKKGSKATAIKDKEDTVSVLSARLLQQSQDASALSHPLFPTPPLHTRACWGAPPPACPCCCALAARSLQQLPPL